MVISSLEAEAILKALNERGKALSLLGVELGKKRKIFTSPENQEILKEAAFGAFFIVKIQTCFGYVVEKPPGCVQLLIDFAENIICERSEVPITKEYN